MLFCSIFPSMHAPSLLLPPEFPESSPAEFPPSLPWPPAEFLGSRDVDVVAGTISSLPSDVLLEIFRRLDEQATDVIRCAAVCKPWRRAIIGNAASLRRPRPDRCFDPRLLLGVFHFSSYQARLRRTPGPFQSALPSNAVGRLLGGYEMARCLIPDAAGAGADDRGLYRELLWSADGFILLMARTVNRLCLFNPITGDCTFLPAAPASRCSAYVLLTGYDDDASPPGTGNKLAVRILAVQKRHRFMFSKEAEERGHSYQVLSTSGAGAGDSARVWGPVQRSGEVEAELQGGLCVWMERRGTVVCRDAVYWLAGPNVWSITCTLALDVRTGRTWTTELPQQRYHLNNPCRTYPDTLRSVPILATSGDGRRLSLMELLRGPRIQVWVMQLDDDARWTLQQTIEIDDMSNLLPPSLLKLDDDITTLIKEIMKWDLSLTAFCPRSGCVVGVCWGMELLIDIHSGSPTCARRIGERQGHDCHPYEMDCFSTYISKMKQF